MGALIDHLKALAADGGSIEDVTAAAEAELAGGALLTAELEDPEGAISVARVEVDALNRHVQGALERFPSSQSAGFHRTDLDPRAMAVIATMAYARRGGVYLPKDLEEMVAEGRVSEEWHARESVRIRVLLTVPADVHRLHRAGRADPGDVRDGDHGGRAASRAGADSAGRHDVAAHWPLRRREHDARMHT